MSELQFRAVANENEARVAYGLIAQQRSLPAGHAVRWGAREGAPGVRSEHTRIALWNGELAAAVRVVSDTIRIGEARLKLGGLGSLCTMLRHRHKGIGRQLLVNTLQYLRSQNYHAAMLFGLHNFYQQWGFTTTLAEYTASVDVFEAETAHNEEYRIRAGKPGDIRQVQKLHNLHENDTACSLIRSAAQTLGRWEQWHGLRVLTDRQGRAFAYFVLGAAEGALNVIEVGVEGWRACPAVLHACATLAMDACFPRVRFNGPPGHLFMRYLQRFKSVHEARFERDGGGMMAFVHLDEALESMVPEWESHVMRSTLSAAHVEVTLLVEGRPYRVRSHGGAVDVGAGVSGINKVSLSRAQLMHLVTGYHDLDAVLETQRRILTEEGRALLAALFPKRTPYVWVLDRF